jgi:hypothetical protein
MRRARLLVAGGGLVLAVVIVSLAAGSLLGDGRDEGEAPEAADAGSGDAVVLVVEEGGKAGAAVLVRASASPRVILGLPAGTLLQSAGGFQTFEILWEQDGDELPSALESLLGVPARVVSSVSWGDLREAGLVADAQKSWPEVLPEDPGEAATAAAEAVASLCGTGDLAEEAVARLELSDGADDVRDVLRSMAGRIEQNGLLPGRQVQGADFAYYEPDMRSLRAVVGVGDDGVVEVEVQNGSGVVGVTEAVTAALQPRGYNLLPVRNADDFPDVKSTRVFSARDVLGEAERVRAALGVGQVLPQEDLPPGRIVVMVGHDLQPGDLSVPGESPPAQLTDGEDQR